MIARSIVLLTSLAIQAGATPTPPLSALVGRWAASNPNAAGFVLHIETDGTVRTFIPAPQFSATYRIEGDRVVIRDQGGSTDTAVRKGESLTGPDGTALTRPAGYTPKDVNDSRGTWTQAVGGVHLMFMTLRSDGEVVLEVSVDKHAPKIAGDKLALLDRVFTVRRLKNVLTLEGTGPPREFVRRPWGCFGVQSDREVPECK